MKAYKVFESDWTCRGYQYEVGQTYETEEAINLCQKGFHACANILDCFKYYSCVPWNKIAEVELLGEIKGPEEEGCSKVVTNKIKIVREIDFAELAELSKKAMSLGVNGSQAINESGGVNGSQGAHRSFGINHSFGVERSFGVNESQGVHRSNGVDRSLGVNESSGVTWSQSVNRSFGVDGSKGVNESQGVNESFGINWSKGVNKSLGVNQSKGVNFSLGVHNSQGVHGSMFVSQIKQEPLLFNKASTKDRIHEVEKEFKSLCGNWKPVFNNLRSLYLKHGSKWKKTPIPKAEALSKKEAWQDMPKPAIDYLKSLPEFDAQVFFEVTGIEVNEEG